MRFFKYSDRVGFSTRMWLVAFVRKKSYWRTSLNVWHFFIIPTIEITKDYDLKFVNFYWLKFVFEVEVRIRQIND